MIYAKYSLQVRKSPRESRRSKKRNLKSITEGGSEAKKRKINIEDIPKEVMIGSIFSTLDCFELAAASQVCSSWKNATEYDPLWKNLLTVKWAHGFLERDVSLATPIVLDGISTYKEAFTSKQTRVYFDHDGVNPVVVAHNLPLHVSYVPMLVIFL